MDLGWLWGYRERKSFIGVNVMAQTEIRLTSYIEERVGIQKLYCLFWLKWLRKFHKTNNWLCGKIYCISGGRDDRFNFAILGLWNLYKLTNTYDMKCWRIQLQFTWKLNVKYRNWKLSTYSTYFRSQDWTHFLKENI